MFRVRGLRPPGPVAAPLVPRCALLPAPSPCDELNRPADVASPVAFAAYRFSTAADLLSNFLLRPILLATNQCLCLSEPYTAELVAGGRGGKERAARYERSSDWPRGAQPPDPEHVNSSPLTRMS
jgi:hypothetical protein